MSVVERAKTDRLLDAFLGEKDEAEASRLLEQLICSHCVPVINNVVRIKLQGSTSEGWGASERQDAEDVSSQVLAELVKRLRVLKSEPGNRKIADFQGYVAVAAYNGCNAYLREKYPAHYRLKQKLRYILSHQKGLALWQSERREWLCGFEQWRDRVSAARGVSTIQAVSDRLLSLGQELPAAGGNVGVVVSILEHLGRPVKLDDLVEVVAAVTTQTNQVYSRSVDWEETDDIMEPAGIDHFHSAIEYRSYLTRVWSEICTLPAEQRSALLLNLSDDDGGDLTSAFSNLGIASIRRIG